MDIHNVKHIRTVSTNSSSHFEVSKACLESGKHLYTEKPLATTFSQAQALVELAEAKGLYFSAAPCSLLGETAQTLWKALRKNEIGKVRVAYGELEDGPAIVGAAGCCATIEAARSVQNQTATSAKQMAGRDRSHAGQSHG